MRWCTRYPASFPALADPLDPEMLPLAVQLSSIVMLATLVGIGAGLFACRPRVWKEAPTDVLILVAHQDDCVVLAGEFALWAMAAGKTVRIAYLTCGADEPGTPRANMREREAIAVWRAAGLPEEQLHFLGYRQSPLRGASLLSDAERLEATAKIARLIRESKPGTAVFLPAAGESHADHRAVRQIGLQALDDSARRDLFVLEAPEYNPYLSLVRAPAKALRYFLRSLPLAGRLARRFDPATFPGFVDGGHAFFLPEAEDLHRRKIKMLRGFASEDGNLLIRHFGWKNRFRPARLDGASRSCDPPDGYIRAGDQWLGASVIATWFSIYLLVVGLSWEFARKIAGASYGMPGTLLVAAGSCAPLIATIRKRAQVESSLLYLSAGLGMIIEAGRLLMRHGS